MQRTNGLDYEVQGEGEPVLLIHGSILADAYLPFCKAPSLSSYRLIRYHRRGFAGSEHHIGPFSIEEQAQDALKLLRHLGVERAHVCGHSYGGAIALQLALDAPRLVHSLVLEEPAVFMVPSAADLFAAMEPAGERYGAGDAAGAIQAFLSMIGPGWEDYIPRNLPGASRSGRRNFLRG
jgi:pimeloyl-ACP methyl ester carboxylesterase